MSVSEQIAALATKLAGDRTMLENLIRSLDDKPNDTTITAQVDQLSGSVTADSATLSTLQNAERALMTRAQPVAPSIITARPREQVKPEHVWRAGVVCADAYFSGRPYEEIVRERYPDSVLTQHLCTVALNRSAPGRGFEVLTREFLTRATQGPANTYTPGYAQELVHQTYAAFMDLLQEESAVAKIAWRGDSFTNGSPIVVPYRDTRGAFPDNFEAAFRREGDPIRVGRLATTSKTLYPYSMGVIGTMTRELMRRSTPSIEAMIRKAMLEDTAAILDNVVFGATAAVTGVKPAGLLWGINAADTRVATATPTPADIDMDLNKMINQLVAVRGLGGPRTYWVMNRSNAAVLAGLQTALGTPVNPGTTMNGGTLKGFSVATSSKFPVDQILLVDADAIFFVGGAPEFEMSTEATLHEENTTPLQIGAPATPVRSLFQTNSAALRMIQEVSWDDLRVGAIQQLTAVAWVTP